MTSLTEHTIVKLTAFVTRDDATKVPPGTMGAVVGVYGDGMYEVEIGPGETVTAAGGVLEKIG